MARHRGWVWVLAAAGLSAGCGPAPTAPDDTGSREAVRGFYEAVLAQDWPRAYRFLHPVSQGRTSPEQFADRARNYRRSLGLEPEAVRLRSCEEHGTEAVAHVVLTGRAGRQTYKDAITLRRNGAEWGVVLPPSFGKARPQ